MAFQTIATYYFDKKFKKLTKKDGLLKERVIRKLQEISINPEIGEPKRHALRGLRSEHIDPFVIIYIIIKDVILLINFDDHDKAYDSTPLIQDRLLCDPRTIEALESAGIKAEEYIHFVKSIGKTKCKINHGIGISSTPDRARSHVASGPGQPHGQAALGPAGGSRSPAAASPGFRG